MAKFFTLEEKQVQNIMKLFERKFNNEYVLIQSSNGFTDIAQYSDKYQNVRLCTVKSENLVTSNRIA